jgi:hypothetical protein
LAATHYLLFWHASGLAQGWCGKFAMRREIGYEIGYRFPQLKPYF